MDGGALSYQIVQEVGALWAGSGRGKRAGRPRSDRGESGEGGEGAGEDVVEVGEEDAVVDDGDVGGLGGGDAGEHFAAGEHAGAAVDDEGIGGEVCGPALAGGVDEVEVFSGFLLEEAGDFDGADVIVLAVVGAAFGDEDFVAVAEVLYGAGAGGEGVEVAFVAGEEDGEGGEGDALGDDFGDAAEDLGVGDDEAGRVFEPGEGGGESGFLGDDAMGVGVEDVADGLLLGEDEAAFGRGGVDGGDEDDGVAMSLIHI